MASEIRVDKINSLSGVGTVTLSPTGVDIAGITTAATLRATTGIVTSLTATTGIVTTFEATTGNITTLRAPTGISTHFTADKISLPDSSDGSLCIGIGSDLKFNHNGGHSYITEVGGGDLYIQGSDIILRDAGTLEKHIEMTQNGAVDIYHNGTKKFETTSDGSKVTGELDVHKSGTGDVFHVQGNGTGAVVAKVENAYNSDNDRFAILELKSGKGSIRFNSNGDSNEGAITYNMADNTMVFGVNNASEKLRIQSGGGISFNGDTAAANALNDYEEGTFNAGFNDFNGSYTQNTGTYVKIGSFVQASIMIIGSGGSGSGDLKVANLPFATDGTIIGSLYRSVCNVFAYTGLVTGGRSLHGVLTNNTTVMTILGVNNNATATTLNRTNLNSGGFEVQVTCTYQTAA